MSKHIVEVVRIGAITPHPDPEVTQMEITHVHGWQCCIRKGQFKEGDLAVYIEPDYMVPLNRPEFEFLKKGAAPDATHKRITVMRLRGAMSQGLLLPVPEFKRPEGNCIYREIQEGDNLIDYYGIERYVPPTTGSGIAIDPPKTLYIPVFDVENAQRFDRLIQPGEEVVYTEKMHGESVRFTYATNVNTGEREQFAGSRTVWYQRDEEKNNQWQVFAMTPAIGMWCKANPEKVLYGEIFGAVQNLKYGTKGGQKFFAAFAVMDGQNWMDWEAFRASMMAAGVPVVPFIYRGPHDPVLAYRLAEEDSRWPGADHCSEGIVVLPVKERIASEIGRVMLKIVSNRYLEGGKVAQTRRTKPTDECDTCGYEFQWHDKMDVAKDCATGFLTRKS